MLIADLKNEIELICSKSKNAAQNVKIVAVSKLQPSDKIRTLFQVQHQNIFAENYPQEALEKIQELSDLAIEWHLIGHLQKNKINSILGKFRLIHSIDSLELAKALSQKAQKNQNIENILLQVNIAEEKSKGGFSRENLIKQWPEISQLPFLKIYGLMTMPPIYENPELTRPHFTDLRNLLNELKKLTTQHPLTELSMGTSHDYRIALEEGATYIRIGTLLFGERKRG